MAGKTEVLPADQAGSIRRALQVLRSGGLVAFPTDTVYGVGADLFNRQAIARLYAAKGRPTEKAIPVLLAGVAALPLVALDAPASARRLAERYWPGPLTIVLLRRPELPPEVSPDETVGVRVPDHPVALALLSEAPLAVTSANRSGEPSLRTCAQVLAALERRIDLLLDGGDAPGGLPSTVVDCTRDQVRLLRDGPIPFKAILEVLG